MAEQVRAWGVTLLGNVTAQAYPTEPEAERAAAEHSPLWKARVVPVFITMEEKEGTMK